MLCYWPKTQPAARCVLSVSMGFDDMPERAFQHHQDVPCGTIIDVQEGTMTEETMIRGNGETLLVVEDEMQLLVMITYLLEGLGYKVITARSGQDALEKITDGVAFDLMLTDVVMPGSIGGFELARKVRAVRPDVRIIYLSGYTGFSQDEMGDVRAPVLPKPTPPHQLASALAEAFAS